MVALNSTGTHDFVKVAPQNELHALYINDDAREQLYLEVKSSFGKAAWPDASRGSVLCLKVSDDGALPSPEARLSPTKMAKYRDIESEGDGMRSYAATCVALLLGLRPVCLLDEPELCLHPPQAYNLGKFIGRFGSSEDTATFVATHSSHVLRGAVQTAQKLQIVRLTRSGTGFRAHTVSSEALSTALAKPTVRAEAILDGIFSQAVIVLEADTDRTVYQAVWETLHEEFRLDIHFAAVGGTGGIADTCQLYRTLEIPVSVVADLDVVADLEKLKRIIAVLAPADQLDAILQEATDISAQLKLLPPTILPEELRDRLSKALAAEMDWCLGQDVGIRKDLSSICNELDRLRRIKRGGVDALPQSVSGKIQVFLSRLATHGIFLVPVGELEEWLKSEQIESSKHNKSAWANEAAAVVRKSGQKSGDIWDFLRMVGAHLREREQS
ncbi:MAG: AAA family ATPase [Gemmatimonas sp.]|nr:AAA family ATPase [Gemmatimonas sp.]